jgi:rod shape-determining protein MreC
VLRFIQKNKGLSVAIAAIIFVLVMAISSFFTKGRVSPVSNAVNTVFRPLHAVVGRVDDWFSGISDALGRYEELWAGYERLRVYVANMEEERRLVDEIFEENILLRQMLEFAPRERGFLTDIATVVARDTSEWGRTLTLNKGAERGIEVGQCVISSEGFLVGIISEAGTNWATVRTLIDTSMSAGAKVSRTAQTAVAEGDWHSMREGRLRLNFLPLGSDIQHDDIVLTSGLGGIYPPGLPIGRVAGVVADMSGQMEYAELIPMVAPDTLNQVFVVLEYIDRD